jgi:hypothetical protein|tara:strand:+ start:314 stop:622 length:309 start_codon:yes stop_codon:yes gene_type:complete
LGRIETFGGDVERGRDVREDKNALSSHNANGVGPSVNVFVAQISLRHREEFRERRGGIRERTRIGAVSFGVLRVEAIAKYFRVRFDDIRVEFVVRRQEEFEN